MSSYYSSDSSREVDPCRVWIYHERQESLLCGQHALNNLMQNQVLDVSQLAEAAHELDALELQYMADNNEGGVHSKEYRRRLQEGSTNVDERGNFSIQVLKRCMDQCLGTPESLPHYTPNVLKQHGYKDVTELSGFLCHKSDHWFAIRKVGGRFWNLNSTAQRPHVVSHFQLGLEMQSFSTQGYTVFCMISPNLPADNVGESPPEFGRPDYWHNMADLLSSSTSASSTSNNGTTITNSNKRTDPWRSLTGKGMRLDGKSSKTAPAEPSSSMNIDGLTEEEQLQLALQLSEVAAEQQPQQQSKPEESNVDVPPEPAAGTPNTCRIQFRVSNGTRTVRTFHKHDTTVAVLYAYCRKEIASGGSAGVELRAGFPPKDLEHQKGMSLDQAGLAGGESIQVRLL